MATVTKPIALDESFNTTEVTPRNTADVLAQELSAIATAIGNQQSAGHIIENPAGGVMPQRDGLQFVDSHLTDDSGNNRTQVSTLKPVNSAAFETETEDGFYFITDEDEQPLTADDIPYDSNTSVGDMIDGFVGDNNLGSYTLLGTDTEEIPNGTTSLGTDIFTNLPSSAKRVLLSAVGAGNVGGVFELVQGATVLVSDFGNGIQVQATWSMGKITLGYASNTRGYNVVTTFTCYYK